MAKRFFSDESFWNQPVADGAETDGRSGEFIEMLAGEPNGPFGINIDRWTVPVYEVDAGVPKIKVARRTYTDAELAARGSKWVGVGDRFHHGAEFDLRGVPIPPHAVPDPSGDAHMAVVDWGRMWGWDMWAVKKNDDGSFCSNTGMAYRLDGDGVFKTSDFDVADGESIHFHGPSRAAGVPAIAGLIMLAEVAEGCIRHKLACATRFNAFKEFVFPACWTDGHRDGGLPEGAVIQLDPELDLTQFDLLAGERVVARAFQEYGAVNVDNAGGNTLYAESMKSRPGKSWNGILTSTGLMNIPMKHYRVLTLGETTRMGEGRRRGVGH
jgi:hypothetical protein